MVEFHFSIRWRGNKMPPIRERVSLYKRYSSDKTESVDPFVKHFIITEGENTEMIYLELLRNSAFFRIRSNIMIIPLEKTDEDTHTSAPNRLLEFIKKFRAEKQDLDAKYIIMFDRDSFKNQNILFKEYAEYIKNVKESGIELLVSSPCIELWLLLHKENSYVDLIRPNYTNIFNNNKISNTHTYTSRLCSDEMGFNPKNNIPESLISKSSIAIIECENLTKIPEEMEHHIGSNMGEYLKSIQNDPR